MSEIFEKILITVFGIVGVVLIGILCLAGYHYIAYSWQPEKEYSAILESTSFVAGQTSTGAGTVVGADGKVGVGVISSSSSDEYVTVWNVEGLGRIVSKHHGVYMSASEKTRHVAIREHWGQYEIFGCR